MRDELITYSLMSPFPVLCYHSASQIYIAYWHGIPITRSYALLIAQGLTVKSWPSPQQKDYAFNEWKRAFYTHALGDQIWIGLDSDHKWGELLSKIQSNENIKKAIEDLGFKEVLAFFDTSKATVLDD